jgi:hypothetical protein
MTEPVRNLLLEKVAYKMERTRFGVWRRFVYPSGQYFAEFRSHRQYFGWPLLHYTRGVCPETGTRIVAKGIIAIGRLAVGALAIGHASAGLIAIGQLGVGVLLGLGQASTGVYAIGQLALGVLFGLGQLATGEVVIAQLGIGKYVLAQIGVGTYVWDMDRIDPEARAYFSGWWLQIQAWFR